MKATKAEIAQRVSEILEIRLAGARFHDIVQYAAEKQWGVAERQLWNYIAASDKLLAAQLEPDRERLLTRHLAQRHYLYGRAVNAGDYRVALAALKDEAELLALYPAKRTELTGKDGGPLEAVQATAEMTDDERRAAVANLLARVGASDAGPAAHGQAPAP